MLISLVVELDMNGHRFMHFDQALAVDYLYGYGNIISACTYKIIIAHMFRLLGVQS